MHGDHAFLIDFYPECNPRTKFIFHVRMNNQAQPLHCRSWIWLVYLILFALSVPWYIPEIDPIPVWFGLPYWVVISISACIGIACFTSFVIYRYWPDDED